MKCYFKTANLNSNFIIKLDSYKPARDCHIENDRNEKNYCNNHSYCNALKEVEYLF